MTVSISSAVLPVFVFANIRTVKFTEEDRKMLASDPEKAQELRHVLEIGMNVSSLHHALWSQLIELCIRVVMNLP